MTKDTFLDRFLRGFYLTGPTASGKTAVGVALGNGWAQRSLPLIR